MKSDPLAECSVCGKAFHRRTTMHSICSARCVIRVAREMEKDLKAFDKRRREAIKTRSQWMKEAQTAFNAYIRARDQDKSCVSCGRHHEGQWHAGHYLSTGARPELRFNEDNCHKQCQPCNTHLHGNLVMYRAELIRRIGLYAVERLEGPQTPKKYTIPDLKEIRDEYREKLRNIRNSL